MGARGKARIQSLRLCRTGAQPRCNLGIQVFYDKNKRSEAMIIHILLIFFMINFGGSITQTQNKLIPFQENDEWGFKDKEGMVRIKPQFVIANDFSSSGIAAVVDSAGWAYIDTVGNVIIRPFIYDNGPDYFSEGLARFTMDGKFGFFDEAGRIIIKSRFDFAFPFSEGLSVICFGCKERKEDEHHVIEGGAWGYINNKGEVVIDIKFESARSFENGRAQVMMNGEWIYIDKTGNIVK